MTFQHARGTVYFAALVQSVGSSHYNDSLHAYLRTHNYAPQVHLRTALFLAQGQNRQWTRLKHSFAVVGYLSRQAAESAATAVQYFSRRINEIQPQE